MNIEIEKKTEGEFSVTVREGESLSSHAVTVERHYYELLTGGRVSAEELIRKSFEFLLEREPKEAILGRFDLAVIARYFPSYESEIKRRL